VFFTLLWLVFFLQGMTPGFWVPGLTNILTARGLGDWVPAIFLVPTACVLISPLIGGALADQRVPADRLFAWSSILGSVVLVAAFGSLDAGWHPAWFVSLLGLYSLLAGPSWGLLTMVSLTHLSDGERGFPQVRAGATLGWMAAGLMTSYLLHMDASPASGYASAVARVLSGLLAFLLPHTPPLGGAVSLRSRLGLDALSLMKQRDTGVLFLVTTLFSIPLTAFYMYGPELLIVMGDTHPMATMSVAQVLEVVSMFLVGAVMVRYRIKTVLLWALGISVLRYGMSAYAGASGQIGWHIAGLALHGVSYAFYFVTAQIYLDRRVDPGLKGQAQGLLAVASAGVGPLVGALVCGWLRARCVTPDGHGWALLWAVLAAMIAACFVIFAVFYRGLGRNKIALERMN
jgi:MFS family permease